VIAAVRTEGQKETGVGKWDRFAEGGVFGGGFS